jgi:DNA polymerase-4
LTRDVTLDEPTDLETVIFVHVLNLFHKTFRPNQKVRLLGVRASHLAPAVFQKNLLEAGERERFGRVARAADQVRDKFGFDSLRLARSLEPVPGPRTKQRE